MAEGKSLKFQFVLDEQSFARVKRALGELTTEASKFAKAMQGAGGGMFGGANVGRPPSAVQTQGRGGQQNQRTGIGAAILGDVDAFQKLSKSGKAGMDAMTQAVRSGVREQMREIEKLEGKMASLNKVYAKDPRAAYMGSAFTQNLQAHMLSTQGQISAAQGRLSGLQGLQGVLPPGAPGWGGAPAAGAGGAGAAPPGGVAGMGGMAGIAAMAAKIAGMALAGGTAILKTSVSADHFGLTQEAMRGQALAPAIARMKRGDISDQMALKNLQGRSQAEQMEILRSVVGKDNTALSKLQAGLGLVNPFGARAGDLNQALEGTFGNSQQTTEMIQQRQATLDAVKQTAAFQLGEQRYLDFTDSTRGSRMQSARIAGLGLYTERETRTPGNIPFGYKGRPLDEKRTKAYFDYLRKNAEQGIDEGAVMSGIVESRQQTGTGALGRQFALQAASGYGGFNAVQGAAARLGNPALARMALGGGINTNAGIQLGQGFLGTGFDPRGTVSAFGALGAFQGGYGELLSGATGGSKAADFNLVHQAIAGLGVGDALTSGSTSGWQQGMNVLSAIRANPTGDAYATDFLATGMTFKQMLAGARGSLTETALGSNITPEMIKAQLGGVAEGALSMWSDSGANDPRSRAMRKYQASGKGLNEFMRTATDEDAKAMATQLGMMNPQFGEEGAIGYMRMTRGMAKGTTAAEGGGTIGGVDDEIKRAAKRAIDEMEQVATAVREHWGKDGDITKDFKDFQKVTTSLGDLSLKAEDLARKFGALAGLSQIQIEKALKSGTFEAVKTAVNPPGPPKPIKFD